MSKRAASRSRYRRSARALVAAMALLVLVGSVHGQTSHRRMATAFPEDPEMAVRDRAGPGPGQRISFDFSETPLPDALARIAALSHVTLVYADGLIPKESRITVRQHAVTPEEAFSRILAGTPLEVVISPSGFAAVARREPGRGRVEPPPAAPGILREPLPPRDEPVAMGTLLDGSDRPIVGGYVRLCGTRRVELTDSLGRFEFSGRLWRPARISMSGAGYSERVVQLPVSARGRGLGLFRLQPGRQTVQPGLCSER